MAAADPIRTKNNLKRLSAHYLQRGQHRNYLLVLAGVHTALRISDLLRLRWCDVYDFAQNAPRNALELTERKTGKRRCIALNKQLRQAVAKCAPHLGATPEGFVFQSRRRAARPISRVQAYRILRAAAESLRLPGHISCHSLRKTLGYHAWKAGTPVAVIMDIYNHTSYAVTRRYLGITQDDRNQVYLTLKLL